MDHQQKQTILLIRSFKLVGKLVIYVTKLDIRYAKLVSIDEFLPINYLTP